MRAYKKRLSVINVYNDFIGRNYYNQNLRNYCLVKYTDGKYYSDCSSSVSYAYKRAGFGFGILNTATMYLNKNFEEVPVIIKNGIIQNKEILREGDMLLYAGKDLGRKYAGYVGHVEMIHSIKDGKYIIAGHPSGNPRLTDMDEYCLHMYNATTSTPLGNRTLIKVVRSIKDDSPIDNIAWIKKVQSIIGTKADGIAGVKTFASSPTVKKGMKGLIISAIQQKLSDMGYDVGNVDGDFGRKTESAVKDFQEEFGLEQDAIIGRKTWSELYRKA